MTQSCCSLGSPEPPRASGSRRQCFLCGAAPHRRSPWPRRACKRLRWPLQRSAPSRRQAAPRRAYTRDSRGGHRRAACATHSSQSGRCSTEMRLHSSEHVKPARRAWGCTGIAHSIYHLAAMAPSSVRLANLRLADHGRRSSGHARDSATARHCWPRARRKPSTTGVRRERPARDRSGRQTARQIAAGWLLALL